MGTLWAILRLTRADSSLLGFLALVIPIYSRTRDLTVSLERSIPLLFIYICTFIANDLHDLERDQINHPDRPLPAKHLNPAAAAVSYFVSLGFALFLTRGFVEQRIAFWYYGLITISISYGYVVEFFPSFKAVYVAAAISVPLFIVAMSFPQEKRLYLVAVVGFLLSLGRELCMDIDDRSGDTNSFIHRIPPLPLAVTAFLLQGIGVLLLLRQVRKPLDIGVEFVVALLLLLSGFSWFSLNRHRMATRLMKFQLLVGLYFLT